MKYGLVNAILYFDGNFSSALRILFIFIGTLTVVFRK